MSSQKKMYEVAGQANDATTELVQQAIVHLDGDAAQSLYVGCMTVLGALRPTALIAANKPRLNSVEEVRQHGSRITADLLNQPELLMFAAVLTAKMPVFDSTGKETDDPDIVGVETHVEFGPSTIFEALQFCEKAFGYKIDHLLDTKMVEMARSVGAVQFNNELMKRSNVQHLSNRPQ